MRFLVCGGRDFDNGKLLWDWLLMLHEVCGGMSCIIEGGAQGADMMARKFAEWHKIPVETYKADWAAHKGGSAGPIRNARMLKEGRPDCVVGFPTGGPGTEDMLAKAQRAKVKTIRVTGMFAEGYRYDEI